MTLPVEPPIDPMLSKLTRAIPDGDEWVFEPKWDGFRAIVFRDADDLQIQSRDRRDLVRYFPELVPLLQDELPDQIVIDGEVIITTEKGLDFDALQLRIHPAESRVRMLAQKIPASFVAFDLLAIDGKNLMDEPFSTRSSMLEAKLPRATHLDPTRFERVMVTPQTDDVKQAERWFDEVEAMGLDGLIAKDVTGTYKPGKRDMIKIKRQHTADTVVAGYRLSKAGDGIGSLLLGVYDDDGTLHYIGHTSSFKAAERRRLLKELQPLRGESFGGGRAPGGQSRWARAQDKEWVSLRPELVCEVSYDKMQSGRIRHAATFIRWRDDKRPDECLFDQFLT